MTTGKTVILTRWTFVSKVMPLLFNMLSRFVIAFLLRSKHLLISWLQSRSAVIWEPKNIKFVTISIGSPSIYHEVIGMNAMIFIFWISSFNPTLSLSSFTFIRRIFCSSSLSAIRVVSSYLYWQISEYLWWSINCIPLMKNISNFHVICSYNLNSTFLDTKDYDH